MHLSHKLTVIRFSPPQFTKPSALSLINSPAFRTSHRRPKTMGITDPQKTYDTDDLAPGKKINFAATGVTDGALMRGVRFFGSGKRTHSLVMTTESKHIRFVDTVHIEGGPDTVIRF